MEYRHAHGGADPQTTLKHVNACAAICITTVNHASSSWNCALLHDNISMMAYITLPCLHCRENGEF
jgi:hypothetical protein